MKAVSLLLLIVTVLGSQRSFAQDVSASSASSGGSEASNSASLSGSRKGSASEGHASAAEQSVQGSGSISTNIGEAVPKPSTRKWGMELYAEDYYEADSAAYHTGKMETAQFLGVTYTFSPNLSGYVRQNFAASLDQTAQGNRSATSGDDVRMGDTELGLATKNLATWAGGSLNITNRFYLPTGKYSRAGAEIAYLREIVVASKAINKYLETGFAGDFRLAAFGKNGYIDKFGSSKENRNVLMNPALYLTGKANDKLSATVYAGTLDVLKHSFNGASGTHISATYLDASISAQIASQIALTVGAENDMNIGKDQIGHPQLYRAEETLYYLNVYATL